MPMPVETPVPELDKLEVQAWRVYWTEIERRIDDHERDPSNVITWEEAKSQIRAALAQKG